MQIPSVSQISKAVAALSAGEVAMAGAGLITGSVQTWAAGAIAAAVATLAVFVAPANSTPGGPLPGSVPAGGVDPNAPVSDAELQAAQASADNVPGGGTIANG